VLCQSTLPGWIDGASGERALDSLRILLVFSRHECFHDVRSDESAGAEHPPTEEDEIDRAALGTVCHLSVW